MPKYTRTAVFSMRISPEDRDAIAKMASELGITPRALVIRKVLGRMPVQLENRVARVEARIARLERRTYGVALSNEDVDRMIEQEESL